MLDPRDTARWRRVVEALRDEASRSGDPRLRGHKLIEVGDVLFDRLGDARGAADAYVDAISASPRDGDAGLRRLERLARESGDGRLVQRWVSGLKAAGRWAEAVAEIAGRADRLRDARKRCRLRLEAARLSAEKLADVGQARRLLVAAAEDAGPGELTRVERPLRAHLAETPHDEEAATALARLLARCERVEAAVDLLADTATHLRDLTHKAALLYEAAFLCERAGLFARAPEHLYRVLVYDPSRQAEVEARLDALARRAEAGDPALIDALVRVFDELGQPARSQALLARRAGGADRLRLARHAEQALGDRARAFELYRAAAAEGRDPSEAIEGMRRTGGPDAFEAIAEICTRHKRWVDLAALLADEAAVQRDDDRRAALLHRAGEVLEERLGETEKAMERYVEAFRLRPREPRYLEAGERLYRKMGEWAMVDRLLGLRIRVADDDALRRPLLVEQARVRQTELGDALGAYDALRSALRKMGDATVEDGAFGTLQALVRDEAAFAAIARGLRRRADSADEARGGARALLELAALHLDLRGEREAGLTLVRQASERAPADWDLFMRAADQFEVHGDWSIAYDWLRGVLGRPFGDAARVTALRRAGRLARDGGDAAAAQWAWENLLDLEPRDEEAFAEAVAAAESADDPRAAADLLDAALADEIGPPGTPDRRRGWLRALADARGRLGDAASAARCHAALLDLDPGDLDALAALEPWLRSRGEHAALATRRAAAVGAIEAGGEVDVEGRRVLAALHASADAPGEAARWLAPVAEISDAATRARLFALYAAAGERAAAIAMARRLLRGAALTGDERRQTIERLVALAAEAPVDEPSLTVGLMLLADARPDDPEPARRLAALARETEDDAALLSALGRLRRLADDTEQPDILREMARVRTAQTGGLDDAVRDWEAVLGYDEDDPEALAALVQLQTRRGDDRAVYGLLWRRQAIEADADERFALLREAAVIAELRLGDPARAVSAWQTALTARPGDDEALDELMRLAEDRGDLDDVAALGARRIEGLTGRERLELARRLAQLAAGPLDDPEAALDWWRVVAELDPDEPEALAALARDAEARGAGAVALLMWGRVASGRAPPRLQRTALEARARLLEDQGEAADAIDAWRAVADRAPRDPTPLVEIRRLALALGDAAAAAEALLDQIDRTDDDARPALERRLAALYEDALDDRVEAAAAWERVLAARPRDGEALEALVRLYAEQGRALEMFRVLDALVRIEETEAAMAHIADAAARVEARGDVATAFECWRRAHHLADDVAPTALAALARLSGPARRRGAYADALARSAGRSEAVDEQRRLMLAAAEVRAELGDLVGAFGQVQAACALDPGDDEALTRLERLAARIDDEPRWAALAEILIAAAESDPERRATRLMRAARIDERRRGRPDAAFSLYARTLDADAPIEPTEARAVEVELLRLADARGRWAELIELFDARARALADEDDRAGLLSRLGAALEARGKLDDAFAQYLLAYQLRPLDPPIQASTHRLAAQLDGWDLVDRFLRRALENADGPGERVPILRALAALQRGPLDDPAAGFETLKRAFALDPGDMQSRAALEDAGDRRTLAAFFEEEAGWAESHAHRIALYRAAVEGWKAVGETVRAATLLKKLDRFAPDDAELVDERLELLRLADDAAPLAAALERQSERADGARRLALLRELAVVYDERLGQPDDAESAWRRVLDARPHDADAFEALAASLTGRQAWAELDDALARRIERTTAVARRDLMRRRAELLHRRRGRPVEAFALLAEVARAEPGDLDLLGVLARRAEIADAHAELVVCAERAISVVPRARLPEVLTLIGRTARDRLDDPRKALSNLARALEQTPDDLALAREVAALMRLRRQHGPLAELQHRVGPALLAGPTESPDDPEVTARWALSLAELYADRLYRLEPAIEVVRALVAEQSTRIDALRRLRALCSTAQDGAGLLDATERLAGLTMGAERLAALVDGARELTAMGDAAQAVRLWRIVLVEAPGHPEAQKAVARQASRQEDWALMAEQLEARIRAARDATARADLLCELASLARDRLDDPAAATAAFTRALTAAPDHVGALAGRAELARATGADLAELTAIADALDARLDRDDAASAPLRPLLAALHLDRARLTGEAGDDDTALMLLIAAHGLVPDDDAVGQTLADALYTRGDMVGVADLYRALPMPPQPPGDEGQARAEEHLRRARALRAVGDDALAMRHFEGAMGHPATRAIATEHLANMQEVAGRWEAAARLREKLAESVTDPQAKRAAWVAAGLLLQHRLARPAQAMQAYDKAVDAGLGEPVLLGCILALYREQQRPERVLGVVETLLAGDSPGRRRSELWCDRAWALGARGDAVGAREAYRTALSVDPASVEAARGVFDGLADAGSAEQAETLAAAQTAVDAVTGRARLTLLSALLDWHTTRDDRAAMTAVAADLVALAPDYRPGHETLSRLGAERVAAGDLDALGPALAHTRADLRLRPGMPEVLDRLATLCRAAERPRWAALPEGLLAMLGERDAAPRLHPEGAPPLPGMLRKAHLTDEAVRNPAGALLHALHPWVAERLDQELRAAHRAGQPAVRVDRDLARLATTLARDLGLAGRAFTVDPDAETPARLVALDPPTLALGRPVIDAGEATRRYVIAEALEASRGAAIYAALLPAAQARAVIAGAVALAHPDDALDFATAIGASIDRVAEWAEWLNTHLDPRRFDALIELSAPVVAAPATVDAWVGATRRTASRVGLWMSGDLPAVIAWVQARDAQLAEHRASAPRALRALLKASPTLADLHRAAFDDGFWALLDALDEMEERRMPAASVDGWSAALDDDGAAPLAAAAESDRTEAIRLDALAAPIESDRTEAIHLDALTGPQPADPAPVADPVEPTADPRPIARPIAVAVPPDRPIARPVEPSPAPQSTAAQPTTSSAPPAAAIAERPSALLAPPAALDIDTGDEDGTAEVALPELMLEVDEVAAPAPARTRVQSLEDIMGVTEGYDVDAYDESDDGADALLDAPPASSAAPAAPSTPDGTLDGDIDDEGEADVGDGTPSEDATDATHGIHDAPKDATHGIDGMGDIDPADDTHAIAEPADPAPHLTAGALDDLDGLDGRDDTDAALLDDLDGVTAERPAPHLDPRATFDDGDSEDGAPGSQR